MPEIMSEQKDPAMPTEETYNSSLQPRTGFFSTAHSSEGMLTDPISTGLVDDPTRVTQQKDSELPWLRINWEIKALVPIACVLLGGMLLFLLGRYIGAILNATWCCWSQVRVRLRFAACSSWFSLIPCSGRWSNCSRRFSARQR